MINKDATLIIAPVLQAAKKNTLDDYSAFKFESIVVVWRNGISVKWTIFLEIVIKYITGFHSSFHSVL